MSDRIDRQAANVINADSLLEWLRQKRDDAVGEQNFDGACAYRDVIDHLKQKPRDLMVGTPCSSAGVARLQAIEAAATKVLAGGRKYGPRKSWRELQAAVAAPLRSLPEAADAPPAERSDEERVKKPPMLLACCESTGNWAWYMHDTYMDQTMWVREMCCWLRSGSLLAVDRTASDPEAVALYDEDMAKR